MTDSPYAAAVRELAQQIARKVGVRIAREAREHGQTKAAHDVLAERERQKTVEGWTPEHDDLHERGEIAGAASAYALYRSQVDVETIMGETMLDTIWPWDASWWKPKDRRRDLVRAGALILAEIERLDRLALARLEPPGEEVRAG